MILIPKLMNLLRLFLTAGRRWGLLGVLGAGFILGQGSAYLYAQVTANPLTVPPSLSLSVERLQEKIKETEGQKELDEEIRNRIVGFYRQARNSLEAAKACEGMTAAYSQTANSASGEAEKIRLALKRLEARPSIPTAAELARLSPAEMEKRFSLLQAELFSLKEELTSLDADIQEQKGRPSRINEELAVGRRSLLRVESDLKDLRVSRESPPVTEARQAALQAGRQARMKEIAMLNRELSTYAVRLQLLMDQRELLARRF